MNMLCTGYMLLYVPGTNYCLLVISLNRHIICCCLCMSFRETPWNCYLICISFVRAKMHGTQLLTSSCKRQPIEDNMHLSDKGKIRIPLEPYSDLTVNVGPIFIFLSTLFFIITNSGEKYPAKC